MSKAEFSTPGSAISGAVICWDGVKINRDQLSALKKHYNVQEEDEHPLIDAGTTTNLLRLAQRDGIRIMAWIAKYLEEDEDPVAFIIKLASDSGLDVDPEDCIWAFGEDDEDDEEESE